MDTFSNAAQNVGAEIFTAANLDAACHYISERTSGTMLLPRQASLERAGITAALQQNTGSLVVFDRQQAEQAESGVTGANFAIAETGSIALESTDEQVRLATTLPSKHFVLLDPGKIVSDGMAAIPHVRKLHENAPRNFLAYITGPSRTADIERVLTIGVHGPKELHIILLKSLSDDFLES
ncbi:MAG: hypothetical protein C0623_13110 [Desulfuromonas sp.]|nr:MAG: hypothetical protein C0623_13110 [Desulfuromonas sp.]